ncbi:MAG: hypothetical protein ACT4O1_07290 [Gemmatimonadota bacterium]
MELSPLFAVLALTAALLAFLLFLYQSGKQRGFEERVASAQIDPTTRLASRAVVDQPAGD